MKSLALLVLVATVTACGVAPQAMPEAPPVDLAFEFPDASLLCDGNCNNPACKDLLKCRGVVAFGTVQSTGTLCPGAQMDLVNDVVPKADCTSACSCGADGTCTTTATFWLYDSNCSGTNTTMRTLKTGECATINAPYGDRVSGKITANTTNCGKATVSGKPTYAVGRRVQLCQNDTSSYATLAALERSANRCVLVRNSSCPVSFPQASDWYQNVRDDRICQCICVPSSTSCAPKPLEPLDPQQLTMQPLAFMQPLCQPRTGPGLADFCRVYGHTLNGYEILSNLKASCSPQGTAAGTIAPEQPVTLCCR